MIFENKGKENTLETLRVALNAAKERGTTLVVASNAGDTLIELIKMQEALGTNVPMVMVGQAYGYPKQGVNTMTDERRGVDRSRCAYHSCRARFERCGTRHQS